MPTYDYECAKCGKQFEAVHSIKNPPLTTCPETLCKMKRWGKGKVKRLLGAGAGLIFKGSGFYITDYRSESYKQGAKKDSASSASTPAKTDTGSSSPKKESKKSAD